MQPLAVDLDHVGVATGDLDAGERTFQNLGFSLTRRSFHRGSRVPGGPIEQWGSGNHCAMLAQGYIEVIGLTDPTKFSSVKSMLDLYQGAHIIAFKPQSIHDVHDVLVARHLPVDGIRELERMTAYGPDGRRPRRVAFRNLYWTRDAFTEARLQYTEHLTPDVMWQPHLLDHPNGARCLSHVFLCSPHARATAQKLAPMLGVAPLEARDSEYDLALSSSRVKILSPAAWNEWSPGSELPPLPAPVGLGVKVRSLADTRSYLARHGTPFHEGLENGIWIDPQNASNTTIYFFDSRH